MTYQNLRKKGTQPRVVLHQIYRFLLDWLKNIVFFPKRDWGPFSALNGSFLEFFSQLVHQIMLMCFPSFSGVQLGVAQLQPFLLFFSMRSRCRHLCMKQLHRHFFRRLLFWHLQIPQGLLFMEGHIPAMGNKILFLYRRQVFFSACETGKVKQNTNINDNNDKYKCKQRKMQTMSMCILWKR